MANDDNNECFNYAYCNTCGKRISVNLEDENAAWNIANEHAADFDPEHNTTVNDTCND